MFTCIECEYQTSKRSNYERHLNSLVHKQVFNKLYENKIKELEKQVIDMSSENKINNEKIKSSEEKVAMLEKQLQEKTAIFEKQLQEKTKLINRLMDKDDNNSKQLIEAKSDAIQSNTKIIDKLMETNNDNMQYIKNNADKILVGAGQIINHTMSGYSYINKTYKDAPVLEPVIDYSQYFKCGERCDAYKYETDDNYYVRELIYHYDHGTLISYISDVFIQIYKKQEPEKQSLWTTDASRLTYYIRLHNKEINRDEWVCDKEGRSLINKTIKPMVGFLFKKAKAFLNEKSAKCDLTACQNSYQLVDYLSGTPTKLPNSKVARTIHDEIVRYICPKFKLVGHNSNNLRIELDANIKPTNQVNEELIEELTEELINKKSKSKTKNKTKDKPLDKSLDKVIIKPAKKTKATIELIEE